MTLALEQLRHALEGLIPTAMATASAAGTPNVTYLSHVEYLDCRRVALSCQFFNKTRRNVAENPYACVFLHDPSTLQAYRMRLVFDHAETAGPLFDRMTARIEAIASHTGMSGTFKLLSADVYAVEEIEQIDGFLAPADGAPAALEPPSHGGELEGLHRIAECVARAEELESLLRDVLEAMARSFGFEHSMLLVPDESGQRLYTLASRGYGESGVGSEVNLGEGLIGAVAQQKVTLRLSAVTGDLRYGRAIRERAHERGAARAVPEVPLPGLPDAQSQLALSLLARDQLIGVLAVESRAPLYFDEWHEAVLRIIGNQIALGIQTMQRRDDGADEPSPHAALPPRRAAGERRLRRFRFYAADDCVFVDDEYLVRNLPGRILWKILRTFVASGRTEFSNRELRLDESLGLPGLKDNLESRLILLRKRLEERCVDVRLVRTGRGRFALDLDCELTLDEG